MTVTSRPFATARDMGRARRDLQRAARALTGCTGGRFRSDWCRLETWTGTRWAPATGKPRRPGTYRLTATI